MQAAQDYRLSNLTSAHRNCAGFRPGSPKGSKPPGGGPARLLVRHLVWAPPILFLLRLLVVLEAPFIKAFRQSSPTGLGHALASFTAQITAQITGRTAGRSMPGPISTIWMLREAWRIEPTVQLCKRTRCRREVKNQSGLIKPAVHRLYASTLSGEQSASRYLHNLSIAEEFFVAEDLQDLFVIHEDGHEERL